MSPLLFLAIAIVVPLLGMIVLGIGARIKRGQVTDDETGPFRRRLESIAPPDSPDMSPGTPGLVRRMRRQAGGSFRKRAPGEAAAPSRDAGSSARAGPHSPAQKTPTPASIRLIERDYSVPLLPPTSADLDELSHPHPQPQPPPAGDQRSRRAVPRPPESERRHDRVISAKQRRRPGS